MGTGSDDQFRIAAVHRKRPPFTIMQDSMDHCVEKIVSLIAEEQDDRRSVFQLGYNLGRLSELTGLGREPFWDRWKDAVAAWDLPLLRLLAQELPSLPKPLISPRANETRIHEISDEI
jgi:hypothetical protein